MNNRPTNSNEIVQFPIASTQQHGSQELAQYHPGMAGMGHPPSDAYDLRALLKIIRHYKWMIIGIVIASLVLSLIGTMLMRPIYKSTTKVEVKQNTGGVKFQNIDRPWESSKDYLQTQIQILNSESIANAVIQSQTLEDEPELNGSLRQRGFGAGLSQLVGTVKTRLVSQDAVSDSDAERAAKQQNKEMVGRFLDRLSVQSVRNSQVIHVSFDSFDPDLSAQIANGVAQEYMKLNDERRFNSTSGAKDFLKTEIEKVRAKLETSEKELTEFARKNRIVDVEDKSNIMSTRMQELSTALSDVQTSRIAAEALFEQSQGDNTQLAQVLDSELIEHLKAQLATVNAELELNSKIYKENYPKMVQLRAQRDDIQASLDSEISRITNSLKNNYEQLVNREGLVKQALEKQKSELLALKDRAVQYNILKREWETNKELYSGLLERMKEMGVASGMEINNISIIDAATAPLAAYKPNLKNNLLVSAIAGLLLALALSLLFAYLDNTIKDLPSLEKATQSAGLGMVPMVNVDDIPEGTSLDLISHTIKEHSASEAYRSIRTSLMFASPDWAPKSILVTSSTPSEGKSTTAINLAIVLAQNNARVLLIDCDLRKPRLHKVFNVSSSPGLSDYIVGMHELNPLQTDIENLEFLPSGSLPPNPAEIIGSNKMDALLDKLNDVYDYIIVDSPPVLGLADAVILGTKIDATMMVVASSQTTKEAIQESVKRIRTARTNVIGAVLNRVSASDGGYAYYNQYYYTYGSSAEKEKFAAQG